MADQCSDPTCPLFFPVPPTFNYQGPWSGDSITLSPPFLDEGSFTVPLIYGPIGYTETLPPERLTVEPPADLFEYQPMQARGKARYVTPKGRPKVYDAQGILRRDRRPLPPKPYEYHDARRRARRPLSR
jgi:hypothetical protein